MAPDIDPNEAAKVFEALEAGRLDQLFTEANTDYYGREGFESLRYGVGVPRESVWRLISAIRRSAGLLVLESAWGDFQVRVTPTAQLMQALYEVDTWTARSMLGRTELPPDEEWIVQDRLLVEEAVLVALGETQDTEPEADDVSATRAEVIAALYDDASPTSEASIIAMRFYRTMRALPDARTQAITPAYVMEIHRLLRGDDPSAGILRSTDTPVSGSRPLDLATPPARILGELQAMHAYSESRDVPFVHPLIKTLALAWWIPRVRPFDEYNHVVARLISMAYALRHGYRVTSIIDWARALREIADDDADLTARVIHQLEVISRSNEIVEEELRRRVTRYREVMARFAALDINHRQALILDRALRAPETDFTIKHHARTRMLGYETARQDFTKLVAAGYLEHRRRGKAFVFRLAPDAERTLSKRLG
ncbi:MAG TPA: hypothetical protein VIL17_01915 [Coriobacteriia bacterium]